MKLFVFMNWDINLTWWLWPMSTIHQAVFLPSSIRGPAKDVPYNAISLFYFCSNNEQAYIFDSIWIKVLPGNSWRPKPSGQWIWKVDCLLWWLFSETYSYRVADKWVFCPITVPGQDRKSRLRVLPSIKQDWPTDVPRRMFPQSAILHCYLRRICTGVP